MRWTSWISPNAVFCLNWTIHVSRLMVSTVLFLSFYSFSQDPNIDYKAIPATTWHCIALTGYFFFLIFLWEVMLSCEPLSFQYRTWIGGSKAICCQLDYFFVSWNYSFILCLLADCGLYDKFLVSNWASEASRYCLRMSL